jgi:hypothetical protein
MIDIDKIILELRKSRPVFHSEADFQHAVAWNIHEALPESNIRLEYPFRREKDYYLDILVSDSNAKIAIELKYKTVLSFIHTGDEIYYLKGHGAQDTGRYDYWKDVHRLEEFVTAHDRSTGYALLLTNDSLYWEPPTRDETVCDELRLSEGRQVSGMLSWGKNAGEGTTKKREAPISITGSYTCNWRDYSEFQPSEYIKGGLKFRYMLITIGKGGMASKP